MAAKFKSISDKGGLNVHLKERGIEPSYFYHLLDDLKLNNTIIATLLSDKYKLVINRHAISRWRNYRRQNGGKTDSTKTE